MLAINFKSVALLVFGGLIPSLFWLWFWLKEDKRNPEPKRLVISTFILGGAAVILAFYFEQYAAQGFNMNSLENVDLDFSSLAVGLKQSWPIISIFFTWALIEEFVKFVAAFLGGLRSKAFDEPVDAMVYMISAALGFAAVENALFLHKTVRLGLNGFDFLMNGNLRFLGATLLHIFSSAIVGAFIASAFRSSHGKKFFMTIMGIFVATILHALFNFFIIVNKGQTIFNVLMVLWVLTLLIFLVFEKIKKIKLPYVQR